MPINSKLVDSLLACTALNPKLVPGLGDGTTKGPIPSAAGLDEIAEKVKVSNLAPADGSNTSHARPTMLSGVSSFVENVNAALTAVAPGAPAGAWGALSAQARQDFAEWQGLVATVALSNIYSGMGLKLSVQEVKLDANGNAAVGCVLREMEKDAKYKVAVNKTQKTGQLFYICQNGKPFAIYHPEIALCPMRQYDKALFANVVTWYDASAEDCHAAWQNPLALDDFCVSRIAWWARNNGFLGYWNYILNLKPNLPVLNGALAAANSVADVNSINLVWPGKGTAFGTAMMAYLDAAGNACPVPDLFLDTMMISGIGSSQNNRMVYNKVTGANPIYFLGDGGALSNFVPVPPFKSSIMELLAVHPVTDLQFYANLNGHGQLQSVDVTLCIAGLKLHKTYSYQNLRLGQIPYLALWPFVPMPQGMNLWHSFYATWAPQNQALTGLRGSDGAMLQMVGGTLGYDWGSQGTVHNVFRPTAANQQWPVCVGSEPFRYAVLTSQTDSTVTEVGLVFMPDHPTFDPAAGAQVGANPVKLAIDFGTTSTVCAMSSPLFSGATEITLPFKDYSHCVTCDVEHVRKHTNIMRLLGMEDGGPAWSWNKKLFSIAQLFDQNPPAINRLMLPDAANQEYYVDGRLFLAAGDSLVSLANNIADSDPLLAQQIMTDMKFNHALDVRNYHAATAFLAGVYTYAVLYLLNEKLVPPTAGNPFIQLLVSYPNDVTLGALRQNWQFAQVVLNRMMAPNLTSAINAITYYNEATAATAYNAGNPNFANGLVSMDIGGGTTDISISNQALHGNTVRNLSVRYAGREIMVSSLLEFYRKVNPQTPAIITDTSFDTIWSNAPAALINHFHKLRTPADGAGSIPYLHDLNQNSTLRMSIEMLLSYGMNLGAVADLNATNLPRQLIAMKFLMLLHIVAQSVRENIDIWKDPATGNLSLVGNKLEINLAVGGTGAQLLQYVFDCPMSQLVSLQTPAAIMNPNMANCLNMMNTMFYEELKDILDPLGAVTQLRIFVDPRVAEKLDVSYGMLKPVIAQLVPAAPGAPVGPTPGFAAVAAAPVGMSDAVRRANETAMQANINGYSTANLDTYLNGETNAGTVVKHGIKDYWEWYERIFFPTPTVTNRGLGTNIRTMSALINGYTNYFTAARMEVASARAAFMIEPEHKPYIQRLKGMYMVEELLNWLIAQHQ